MTVLSFSPADRGTRRLHEPFLERASEGDERGHALGAFLTLRLVDRIAEDPQALKSEALLYQLKAAATYLEEVYPATEDINHLREIVRVASTVNETGNKRLLWAPMLAFAYWLEQQIRLDESLDVLDSTLALNGEGSIDEKISANLQRGRVLRSASRFEDANVAYGFAEQMANLKGDLRSQMVGRIGRSVVMQKTGDLPASETLLKDVLQVSRQSGDVYIEARAAHGLSVTLWLMNRLTEAVNLGYTAFELYSDKPDQMRALSDVGMILKDLDLYTPAKEAFLCVLESDPAPSVRVNLALELLELSSHVQDRVGFERWRRELEEISDTLPPAERVDYEVKLGSGLAAFGGDREAAVHVERGLGLAQQARLGQRVFEAERLLKELRAGKASRIASPAYAEPEVAPEMQSAIDALFALRSRALVSS